MPLTSICDTNVFYDLGAKVIEPAALRKNGEEIAITPVSILEIASKITARNFDERQAAARAALDITATVVPDPEIHLARIWNVPAKIDEVSWRDALIAIAEAKSASELENGVENSNRPVMAKDPTHFALHDWLLDDRLP